MKLVVVGNQVSEVHQVLIVSKERLVLMVEMDPMAIQVYLVHQGHR